MKHPTLRTIILSLITTLSLQAERTAAYEPWSQINKQRERGDTVPTIQGVSGCPATNVYNNTEICGPIWQTMTQSGKGPCCTQASIEAYSQFLVKELKGEGVVNSFITEKLQNLAAGNGYSSSFASVITKYTTLNSVSTGQAGSIKNLVQGYLSSVATNYPGLYPSTLAAYKTSILDPLNAQLGSITGTTKAKTQGDAAKANLQECIFKHFEAEIKTICLSCSTSASTFSSASSANVETFKIKAASALDLLKSCGQVFAVLGFETAAQDPVALALRGGYSKFLLSVYPTITPSLFSFLKSVVDTTDINQFSAIRGNQDNFLRLIKFPGINPSVIGTERVVDQLLFVIPSGRRRLLQKIQDGDIGGATALLMEDFMARRERTMNKRDRVLTYGGVKSTNFVIDDVNGADLASLNLSSGVNMSSFDPPPPTFGRILQSGVVIGFLGLIFLSGWT